MSGALPPAGLFCFPDLKGKTLLITGITRGIGCALLPGLLGQGMNLIAISRGRDRMEAIRDELGVGEERLALYDCDLSDGSAVRTVSDALLERNAGLDGMLHNAAIDTRHRFEESDEAFWTRMFQINLFSAVTLTRKLLPLMRDSRSGRILFTGSVMFELGGSYLTAYTATKGALEGLTRSLAHEIRATGITVNCLVPGAISVEKTAPTPEAASQLIAWQSVQRMLYPNDLLGPICLLLSEWGGAINAQSLTVDGGLMHDLASPGHQEKQMGGGG